MESAEGATFKGRGAQLNTKNPFSKTELVTEHIEGLDEPLLENPKTVYLTEFPKKVLNRIDSPDLSMEYSINAYQGCEHGCIYCYARNTHQYWGYSAGIDFETKIIVKQNAPEILEKELMKPSWTPKVITVSGNTDCYQPAERKFQLTRKILETVLKFRNPIGMITKNSLILRDKDLLSELAALKLVHVMVSLTSLKEDTRQKLEPRTTTAKQRLKILEELSKAGVSTGVMTAPLIPGLNTEEIPDLIKAAADHGARVAGYNIVRLNGSIGEIFTDWVQKVYPDRAEKILNQVKEVHNGNLNDSRWGTRMKGDGKIAESIKQLHKLSVKRFMPGKPLYELDRTIFKRPSDQLDLFG